MNPLDKFQQLRNTLATPSPFESGDETDTAEEDVAAVRAMIQQDTVKRLNDLSQHNNGRVQASGADAETYLCCVNDAAHGKGTVYIVIEGELFELCPDCGVEAVKAKLRDAEVGDVIDVEVLR
jgi:hypothetical protein